jgi:hypothetical protein
VQLVGSDAGVGDKLVRVGDPCYAMGSDARHRVDDWDTFVEEAFGPLGMAPLGPGVGLAVPSGYGDGVYPVYAKYRDGRVAELRIEFIEPDAAANDESE